MKTEKIRKWTDYYGSVRQVTLTKNEDGLFDGGFVCESIGAGISGYGKGTKNPPKKGFFDTFEEARIFSLKQKQREIKDLKTTNDWLRAKIKINSGEIAGLKEEISVLIKDKE